MRTMTTDTPHVLRRLYPGTKLENTYQWPFVPLDQLESSFSLQEYLQALIRKDRENVAALITLPPGQDDEVWQYEHLR